MHNLIFNKNAGSHKGETISDIARYNWILSLNRSELGYLIKAIGPEDICNILQSEG